MGITGKGRCNLTNSCSMADFIAHTPGHGKFLYSAYEQFTNQDLLDKLHTWGLATKEERGGRIFPSRTVPSKCASSSIASSARRASTSI